MQWTPGQLQRIGKARERGEGRVTLDFTRDQKTQWQKAVQEELACKEENSAHYQKILHASKQSGFFADIRRAMMASRNPLSELADNIGVDQGLLSDFRAAEAELPSAVLDRLIRGLGLRLMQEIPMRSACRNRLDP